MTNLKTWALGKYTLACNSDERLQFSELIEMLVPCRHLPLDLYSHTLWDNFKKCICDGRTITVNTLPTSDTDEWFPVSKIVLEKVWW